MRKFKLETVDFSQIVPHTGESLADALVKSATALEAEYRAGTGSVEYWASTVAQLLYLAADALDTGAAASLGHNRSDRYHQRARELEAKADALCAEGKEAQDSRTSAKMMEAFKAGYEDHSEGGTPDSQAGPFSFDARDAYVLGRHYARNGLDMPTKVRSIYERDERKCLVHRFEVDGTPFRVGYEAGKAMVGGKVLGEVIAL